MRLAQAARKFAVTTEDILGFLEGRGIFIEKDSNTKLADDIVELLLNNFNEEEASEADSLTTNTLRLEQKQSDQVESLRDSPEATADIENSALSEEALDSEAMSHVDEQENSEVKAAPNNGDKSEFTDKSFKTVEQLLEGQEEIDADKDFLIKAPKVELKGLNVLGKIDLPEPKPTIKEKKRKAEAKPKKSNRKARSNKKEKRELSPAEIRKRERQKEERKRQRAEKERKKKREQFYKENVLKPKQIQQKSKPRKLKKIKEEKDSTQALQSQPKTVLGKFWRWLNT